MTKAPTYCPRAKTECGKAMFGWEISVTLQLDWLTDWLIHSYILSEVWYFFSPYHIVILLVCVVYTFSQSDLFNSNVQTILLRLFFSRQKHNFLRLHEKTAHISAFPAPTWSSWLTRSGLCVLALSMLHVTSALAFARIGLLVVLFFFSLLLSLAMMTVRVKWSLGSSEAHSFVLTLDLLRMTVIQCCSVNRMLCHPFLSGWPCVSFSRLHTEWGKLPIVMLKEKNVSSGIFSGVVSVNDWTQLVFLKS